MGNSWTKPDALKEELFYICFIGGALEDFKSTAGQLQTELLNNNNKNTSSNQNTNKKAGTSLSALYHDTSTLNLLQAACMFSDINTANRIRIVKFLLSTSTSGEHFERFDINEQRVESGNFTALMLACETEHSEFQSPKNLHSNFTNDAAAAEKIKKGLSNIPNVRSLFVQQKNQPSQHWSFTPLDGMTREQSQLCQNAAESAVSSLSSSCDKQKQENNTSSSSSSSFVCDLIELLLLEGADPLLYCESSSSATALHIAALSRNVAAVTELCGAPSARQNVKMMRKTTTTMAEREVTTGQNHQSLFFYHREGENCLVSAVRGGSVKCVEPILAFCSSEEKNVIVGTASSTLLHHQNPQRKVNLLCVAAVQVQKTNLVDLLLVNGVEWVSQWELISKALAIVKSESVTSSSSNNNSSHDDHQGNQQQEQEQENFILYFQQPPLGGFFDVASDYEFDMQLIRHREDKSKLATEYFGKTGNSLVDACLLQNVPLFKLFLTKLGSFSPTENISSLPNNMSCLHVIASYNLRHFAELAYTFFLEILRHEENCQQQQQGSWSIKDSKGRTPLDYLNENSKHTIFKPPLARITDSASALVFCKSNPEAEKYTQLEYEKMIVVNSEDSSSSISFIEFLKNYASLELLSSITSFTIHQCEHFKNDMMSILDHLPSLEKVKISHCSDKTFSSVEAWNFSDSVNPALNSISFNACRSLRHDRAFTRLLSHYSKQLIVLDLTGCDALVNDSLVGNSIASLESLQTLHLRGCHHFSVNHLFRTFYSLSSSSSTASSGDVETNRSSISKTLVKLDLVDTFSEKEFSREMMDEILQLLSKATSSSSENGVFALRQVQIHSKNFKQAIVDHPHSSAVRSNSWYVLKQDLPEVTWQFQ